MHARRAVLALLLLLGFALVQRANHVADPRPRAELDVPRATTALAVADAPDSIEELRERVAKVLRREGVPGAAIALVGRDGPIWVGGLGVRDLSTGAPMEGDTVFRVGSLSKSVVALGVMRLADQGKLDIDRPLREILPDLAIDNPWEAVAPVTLAQCLEHTAGLDDLRFNEIFTDDEYYPARDALALNPRTKRIRWRPGTRHSYSNTGFTIAARAIEVASGEPFDVYLQREILAPMGITDAAFARTETIVPRLAVGYMHAEPQSFYPFAHRPSASLLASASDLGKWIQFWIRRGQGYPPIVSEAGLARIERSGTLPYPHMDNDYGFANYGDVQHPVFSRGHDGGMPGFHASIRYFTSLEAGYVMLLNSNYTFRGYFEIRSLLFSYLARGRALPAPEPVERAAEVPGADFFVLKNPRNELFGFIDEVRDGWRVALDGDDVHIREFDGRHYRVVPAGDGGYRFPNECGSSVQFTKSIDGTPVFLSSFMYTEAAPYWPARIRFLALALCMLLLKYVPLWAVAVLGLSFIQRRRVLPLSLVIWPAVTGLSCFAMPHFLNLAFRHAVIGEVHPLTIAITASSILLAVSATTSLVAAIYWSLRPDRPGLLARIIPSVSGIAFTAFAIWLAVHGWIGLRTWAW